MNDPVPLAADAMPSARHVRAAERVTTVPLDWPVEFNGVVHASIGIRRPTVADVAAYAARVRALQAEGKDASAVPLPMFDAPDEVLRLLDPDDDDRVEAAAAGFLPRRFRGGAA
jgi:hypothetical protein